MYSAIYKVKKYSVIYNVTQVLSSMDYGYDYIYFTGYYKECLVKMEASCLKHNMRIVQI